MMAMRNGPSFFSDLVMVAVLNFLNQTMVIKQTKLAADGRRAAARILRWIGPCWGTGVIVDGFVAKFS